jgi:hypothetical protein
MEFLTACLGPRASRPHLLPAGGRTPRPQDAAKAVVPGQRGNAVT